jgi:hypothetical protein
MGCLGEPNVVRILKRGKDWQKRRSVLETLDVVLKWRKEPGPLEGGQGKEADSPIEL